MKGWMVWVELTGGTLLQRMRLYPLALRLQRYYNRSTPEGQERIMNVLKANGMTERKR